MGLIKSKGYLEEWARHTLHHICGFALDEWMRGERPDLQSLKNNCGIEVVQDVYEIEQKTLRFAETIYGKPYEDIDRKKIQRFERSGSLTIKDGIIQSASLGKTTSNPNHLIKTIKKKIDLINQDGYKSFDRYGLYVFVETTFIDENFKSFVQQTINAITEYQERYSIKCDMLYLDQWYTLCICDLINNEFSYCPISSEMRELMDNEVKHICPN